MSRVPAYAVDFNGHDPLVIVMAWDVARNRRGWQLQRCADSRFGSQLILSSSNRSANRPALTVLGRSTVTP